MASKALLLKCPPCSLSAFATRLLMTDLTIVYFNCTPQFKWQFTRHRLDICVRGVAKRRKTKEAGGGKSSESERGRSQKSRHKGKNEPHSTAMYSLCNVAGRMRYINTVWIKSATPGCVKFYWCNTEGNSKCPQWIQSTATVDDGKVDTALFECQVFAVSEMRPVEIVSKLLPPLLWPTDCKTELKTKEKEVNNRWACGDVTVFRIDQSNVK